MPDVKISLTNTQNKCLEYVALSVQDWCDNAVHNRARLAQEEIIALLIKHCNENNIAIAKGVDAQITQAYDLKVIKTASEVNDEILKSQISKLG